MFKKSFDWLDKKLGKSGENWGRVLGDIPFLLYFLQAGFIIALAQDDSDRRMAIIFLLNTFLVPVAIFVYPLFSLAKKKYKKVHVYWGPKELFAPILVLGFYCVELACIIKAIVR